MKISLLCLSLLASAVVAQDKVVTFDTLNQALGFKLFQDDNLWDDDVEAVGSRLSWALESKTPTLISYREYTKPAVRSLNARPYSMALYGENEKTTHVSLMFANKGDFEQGKPSDGARDSKKKNEEIDEKELKQAQKLIENLVKADEEAIKAAITLLLGDSKQEFFVTGATKETISRWDWNGHALLLSAPKGEYASLRIMSTEAADNDGKTPRISDDELKEVLLKQVEKKPNGDAIIRNIPMVDQGPKGYCAPATLERTMRFMGVPADMYLLAMAGQTGLGGGTSITLLLNGVTQEASRYGRKIDDINPDINSKNLSKYIDKGIPIMWCCFVDHETQTKPLLKRKEARLQTTDWAAWKQELDSHRKKPFLPDLDGAHIRLIIGYNPETDEVAISDSWGKEFDEYWMTYEEATSISQKSLQIIKW